MRELGIFVLAFAAFASGAAAYLFGFHGEADFWEVLGTAMAAMIGLYVGRYLQRRLDRG